jgi:hypothetical protein
MVNGVYGRAQPRLALAVAEYKTRFGEWLTHAHGSGVMAIVRPPGESSDPDDHVEFQPDLAARVPARLHCEDDGSGLEVSGPAGRCGHGLVSRDDPVSAEAYRWLYGADPWWARQRNGLPRAGDPDQTPGQP